MAYSGYDPDRFTGNQHQAFHCLICLNVVKDPYQCHNCGKMICKVCITSWGNKNPETQCPNRCKPNNITPISSRALLKIYKDLNIKCSNSTCNKIIKLSDITQHESVCLVAKCWNFQICQKPENKSVKANKPCCSEVCNTLIVLKQRFNDKKAVYTCLGNFIGLVKSNPVGFGRQNSLQQRKNYPSSSSSSNPVGSLIWDGSRSGGGITITQGGVQCFLKQQAYLFRTTVTTQGYTGGVHYWEIVADGRTQNQLKIGVTTNKDFDYNSAFCDHPFGFAYYGLGQLRHNSNASGPSYGKKFKKQGILGVFLNMNTGVLAFSLNGQYMGVAYKDAKLTSGTIYPAVALLHCAGCKIKSGLSVPSYFKD